ncbi:MAG: J domain-containing protein [Treponema sp.]|jgi:DnaJ-domain-containing protein 1|nr:J domain-containing protein [Treponema sp.]
MDSMFDRLGELLKQTLESGELPEKDDGPDNKNCRVRFLSEAEKTALRQSERDRIIQKERQPLPEKVKKALDVLGAPYTATPARCRAYYRKKLKQFHPDSNSTNPVVQKVAVRKTRELLDAWETVSGWFTDSK